MMFLDRIVDWWMRRCTHDPAHVAADLAEGDWDYGRVKYCRRCGAVQLCCDRPGSLSVSEWRRPRPLWFSRHAPDVEGSG